MGVIKVFKGINGYKDSESIYTVLGYACNSEFCDDKIYIGNLEAREGSVLNLAKEFEAVRVPSNYPEKSVKLHHFALSVAEDGMSEAAIYDLMRNVMVYFRNMKFQVVVVKHYGSREKINNPHLHVIVNHCNLNGRLFYGSDSDYYRLKEYLIRVTHKNWKYIYASECDYGLYNKATNLSCII